jgi:hypothetical protein
MCRKVVVDGKSALFYSRDKAARGKAVSKIYAITLITS